MASLEEFEMSYEQVREFARFICAADIERFVKEHQQEFEEFLRAEGKEVVDLCPDKE